jgi:hypothetical protein
VREESHLDDMRAAIRGDFERLERRRGMQELMHVKELEPAPAAEPERAVAETLDLQAAAIETPEPEPECQPSAASGIAQGETEEASEGPARSWLARLLAAIPPRQV